MDNIEENSHKRKKISRPETWISNVAKTRRNEGKEYISAKTKLMVQQKKIGPPCNDGCFDTIGLDKIERVFKLFWNIGEYNLQNQHLSQLVKTSDVKHSRVKERPSRSLRRMHYNVICDGITFPICRKAFLSIHGISEKRVRILLNKTGSSGVIEPDKRGKQAPITKISEEDTIKINEHLATIPTVSNHYSRQKSPHRKYFSSDLNIKSLYLLYEEWLKNNYPSKNPVKLSFYRNYFNCNFNIGFQHPKSDTCNFCDKINAELYNLKQNGETDKIANVENQKKLHEIRAKSAQSLLKNIATDSDNSLLAICFDLQKTLPTPKITSNIQYYKRKLWTYNFCVHDIKTGRAQMYVWDEQTAKRGSNEISSCLSHFFQNVNTQIEKIIMFSDNCFGQNKNINIVLANLSQIHMGRFKEIQHIFLVSGHSYLPCDRDFGHIEQAVRNSNVYNPDHYIYFIQNCRKIRPFSVIKMKSEDFLNFNALQSQVTKSRILGAKFKDAKIFKFNSNFKEGFYILNSYNNPDVYIEINLQKGSKNKQYNPDIFKLNVENLPILYDSPIAIPRPKLKDVNDLLPFVPCPYNSYFTQLFASQQQFVSIEPCAINDEDEGDIYQIDYD